MSNFIKFGNIVSKMLEILFKMSIDESKHRWIYGYFAILNFQRILKHFFKVKNSRSDQSLKNKRCIKFLKLKCFFKQNILEKYETPLKIFLKDLHKFSLY